MENEFSAYIAFKAFAAKVKPFSGDEIFSVNGRSVAGLTHSEAIGMFKETKVGAIQVTLGRREAKKTTSQDC